LAAKHSASPTSYRAFSHSLGHEERFPPTRLNAGCGFRKETIAGMRRNGRDAPILFSNGSRDGGSVVRDIDAVGCLRSLRAHVALDGVSWVQSGSVEIAVGQKTACYRIGAVICSLPRASLRSGARFDLLSDEYGSAMPV
jgi:hypothetical protein